MWAISDYISNMIAMKDYLYLIFTRCSILMNYSLNFIYELLFFVIIKFLTEFWNKEAW